MDFTNSSGEKKNGKLQMCVEFHISNEFTNFMGFCVQMYMFFRIL
jgi:hypothetical protein